MKEFSIMVLLFDKGHFKRDELDNKSDIEKYELASKMIKVYSWIYTADEYTEMLNNFKPIEKYVWTYIVTIPKEYGNER